MARRVLCGQALFLAAGMQGDWRKVEEAGGSLFLTETAREVQEEASRFLLPRMRSIHGNPIGFLSFLPASSTDTQKPTAHMGLRATPPGEENTLQHPPPPAPLTPGPTCHQPLPAERHGASAGRFFCFSSRVCFVFVWKTSSRLVTICILPWLPRNRRNDRVGLIRLSEFSIDGLI